MGSEPSALRTSLIWHDEVMSDLVHDRPVKVTLGTAPGVTFVTPDVGTSPAYTIVTPGRRGYLLTLSDRMRGTICLGGVEHDVAEFVRGADEPTGFRATQIGGNDWGVISLEAEGEHKLFFQFVPREEQDWNLGHPMILAAVGGYALSTAALTGVWAYGGVAFGEALFRAASMSSLAIGLAATVRWLLRQDNESRASLAFSVVLHAALLFATFRLYEETKPFEWPIAAATSGQYLVKLAEAEQVKPVPVTAPTTTPSTGQRAAAAAPAPAQVLPPSRPWKRPEGKRPPAASKITQQVGPSSETPGPANPRPTTPTIGVLKHELMLHQIAGRDVQQGIARVNGIGEPAGGPGARGGQRDGGAPGGGRTHGDGDVDGTGPIGTHTGTQGPLDTGPVRAAVCVGAGCGGPGVPPTTVTPPHDPPGDGPTLTPSEIERVIRSRRGMFQACYQKQLDRSSTLNGSVVISFEIGADGTVKSSRANGGTLTNAAVIQCVRNSIGLLHFPAKGGANVNFPFVFSPGG